MTKHSSTKVVENEVAVACYGNNFDSRDEDELREADTDGEISDEEIYMDNQKPKIEDHIKFIEWRIGHTDIRGTSFKEYLSKKIKILSEEIVKEQVESIISALANFIYNNFVKEDGKEPKDLEWRNFIKIFPKPGLTAETGIVFKIFEQCYYLKFASKDDRMFGETAKQYEQLMFKLYGKDVAAQSMFEVFENIVISSTPQTFKKAKNLSLDAIKKIEGCQEKLKNFCEDFIKIAISTIVLNITDVKPGNISIDQNSGHVKIFDIETEKSYSPQQHIYTQLSDIRLPESTELSLIERLLYIFKESQRHTNPLQADESMTFWDDDTLNIIKNYFNEHRDEMQIFIDNCFKDLFGRINQYDAEEMNKFKERLQIIDNLLGGELKLVNIIEQQTPLFIEATESLPQTPVSQISTDLDSDRSDSEKVDDTCVTPNVLNPQTSSTDLDSDRSDVKEVEYTSATPRTELLLPEAIELFPQIPGSQIFTKSNPSSDSKKGDTSATPSTNQTFGKGYWLRRQRSEDEKKSDLQGLGQPNRKRRYVRQ